MTDTFRSDVGLTVPAARSAACPFDPPPAYEAARADQPVRRATLWDGSSCWVLTGYDEVRLALSDPRFSADVRSPGYPVLAPGRRELYTRASFVRMDGPEHARRRGMLTADFSGRRATAMRPQIQRVIDDCLDRMIANGSPADLVRDLALPVPSLVICLLLGVPYADHEFFEQQTRRALDATREPAERSAALSSVLAYLRRAAELKRRTPDADIISRLVVAGELDVDEIAETCLLLLMAGHETTAAMITLGTLALLRSPDQADRLRAEPALATGAVEELLRYLTILHLGIGRAALADVQLGDTLVRAGEGVLCVLSSANRDERVYAGAGELDLGRDAHGHLAFGVGPHLCLGAPLARLEIQLVLATLFRRLPDLRLAVPFDQLRFRSESLVYSVLALPVAW